eukprot:190127-Pleurochrysis_carterae.AAC.1
MCDRIWPPVCLSWLSLRSGPGLRGAGYAARWPCAAIEHPGRHRIKPCCSASFLWGKSSRG